MLENGYNVEIKSPATTIGVTKSISSFSHEPLLSMVGIWDRFEIKMAPVVLL